MSMGRWQMKRRLNDLDFFSGEEETRLGDVAEESNEAVDGLSIISKYDESATKLELAYAYKKMGDIDGAREILLEVITEGNEARESKRERLLQHYSAHLNGLHMFLGSRIHPIDSS